MAHKGSLIIKLSELCNERCGFCFQENTTRTIKPKRTDIEVYKILIFMKKTSYSMVQFTGGEPLIHKNALIRYARFAKKIGIPHIYIQTNWTYLADMQVARQLYDAGVNMFQVSFHSVDKHIQDEIVWMPSAHEKTVQALKNLVELWVYLGVQIVITKKNFVHLSDTVRFLLGLGILHMSLRFPTIDGSMRKSLNALLPSYTEIQESLSEALSLFKGFRWRYMYIVNVPPCIIPKHASNIVIGNNNFLLEPDGKRSYYFDVKKQKNGFSKSCTMCSAREKCIGVEPEYSDIYGFWELTPLSMPIEVDDSPLIEGNALQLYKAGLMNAGKSINTPWDIMKYILTPEFLQAQEIPITISYTHAIPYDAVLEDSKYI